MLNVFLPFTNTFLLCLFFLAWLIPQLLQKSPIFGNYRNFGENPGIRAEGYHVTPCTQNEFLGGILWVLG